MLSGRATVANSAAAARFWTEKAAGRVSPSSARIIRVMTSRRVVRPVGVLSWKVTFFMLGAPVE